MQFQVSNSAAMHTYVCDMKYIVWKVKRDFFPSSKWDEKWCTKWKRIWLVNCIRSAWYECAIHFSLIKSAAFSRYSPKCRLSKSVFPLRIAAKRIVLIEQISHILTASQTKALYCKSSSMEHFSTWNLQHTPVLNRCTHTHRHTAAKIFAFIPATVHGAPLKMCFISKLCGCVCVASTLCLYRFVWIYVKMENVQCHRKNPEHTLHFSEIPTELAYLWRW